MCRMCKEVGRLSPGQVVDHIIPHKGDAILLWDIKNLQTLCKRCHDRTKQKQENNGVLIGCDGNGIPLDRNHHWRNKAGENI